MYSHCLTANVEKYYVLQNLNCSILIRLPNLTKTTFSIAFRSFCKVSSNKEFLDIKKKNQYLKTL